jgi:hypothetical protein
MACETRTKRNQTLQQRADEVRQVVYDVNALIAQNKVKPVIDKKTGAITFAGLDPNLRDDVTDACIYRRIMVTGGALAKAKIAQAEALAGRTVNKQALANGVHSHDGGQSWGSH